ncbi:MAG: hypothetical protein KDC11_09165 [Chitinophagaceae bacterium]|nr:hypothetical protein [Chitinophagaceae bacterium]
MELSINSWIHFGKNASKNGEPFFAEEYAQMKQPQELYRALSYNYMKFFKMDVLCKWAWLGAEALLNNTDYSLYEGMDMSKVGVVLVTSSGCIDVDKKYEESRGEIPSPALFVYTLPNIMLGEVCIRHGFKGEQLCLVSEKFDAEEIHFWVNDLFEYKGMEACLCGWADAYDEHKDICFFWVTKDKGVTAFTQENLTTLYNK